MTTEGTQSTSTLGLAQSASADELDHVIHITGPGTVVVLAALGVLIVTAAIWAFFGTVPVTIQGAGSYDLPGQKMVVASQRGVVDRVLVRNGDAVQVGQPIVEIAGGRVITAPIAGSVMEVLVDSGAVVTEETPVLAVDTPGNPPAVRLYIPVAEARALQPGMSVRVSPANAPSTTYGYLTGRIVSISAQPISARQVAAEVNSPEVAEQIASGPPVLGVSVALDEDANNPTGVHWTIGNGPPFRILDGTPVTAEIMVASRKPISLVFPVFG